jgi:hypothetical protein
LASLKSPVAGSPVRLNATALWENRYYAPKGMMKGYVAIPIRLPTGYIGITEAKLPKEFHLSNMVTYPKKTA